MCVCMYVFVCILSLSLSLSLSFSECVDADCKIQELGNARQVLYHGATTPTQTVIF